MVPVETMPDGTPVEQDTNALIALKDKVGTIKRFRNLGVFRVVVRLQVDEYYYGVRIFPGQDPANVWVGWVTPQ